MRSFHKQASLDQVGVKERECERSQEAASTSALLHRCVAAKRPGATRCDPVRPGATRCDVVGNRQQVWCFGVDGLISGTCFNRRYMAPGDTDGDVEKNLCIPHPPNFAQKPNRRLSLASAEKH